jgi:hypothetical protein
MFTPSSHDAVRFDAVVVAHRRLEHPLWDSGASDLGGALEERLENVVVTTAAIGGTGPCVRDAVGAARFAGASAALVVVPDEMAAREIDGHAAPIPLRVVVPPAWSADAIAGVVHSAIRASDRKACA